MSIESHNLEKQNFIASIDTMNKEEKDNLFEELNYNNYTVALYQALF